MPVPALSADTAEGPLVRAEFGYGRNPVSSSSPRERARQTASACFGFGAVLFFDLAQRVGVPLVPVAIQGPGRVLGTGRLVFRFRGKIRVQVLAPLVTGDARTVAAQVPSPIQHAIDQPA